MICSVLVVMCGIQRAEQGLGDVATSCLHRIELVVCSSCTNVHVDMLDCVCCCVAGGISDADKKRTTQLVSHYREGKEVHCSLHI